MPPAVVFVTTELSPVTPGGAGVAVAGLAWRLAAAGTAVKVLLIGEHPAPPEVTVVSVPSPDEEAPSPFLARSRAAALALAELVAAGGVDRVEFQDFEGLGFWALARRAALGLDATPLLIRVHGPIDLLEEAAGSSQAELGPVREMERACFAMADGVIVPSSALGRVVGERYGLAPERIAVGPPPVPDAERVLWRAGSPPEFVAFGRLGEVKGSHDFVQAALAVLGAGVDTRFRLLGEDGWSVTGDRPMSAWLREMIPEEVRSYFRFQGRVPRSELGRALSPARAVVIPSRFESFCLAAHDARRMGLPLIVADLPAFEEFFSEDTGAVRYDGSVADLARVMVELASDPDRAARLAATPAPLVGDPLAVYRPAPPPVRHPRSQAGAATAGVQRVEAAMRLLGPPPGRVQEVARSILRLVPAPLARLAVRTLPRSLKDRFRRLASWPAEQERRAAVARRDRLAAAVRSGAYPALDDPEVSVVIPCFNQGRYLYEALMSVFEQTFTSFEIIVVDDGSDDPETLRVVDSIDLPRTRVIRQANRGLPAARNAGMAAARGSYFVPLDADDELRPDFLERLVSALAPRRDAAFAHCWAELFGDQEGIYVPRPFNPYLILLSNSVVGCVLLRREAWQAVDGYDESMIHGNEDWDLWVRLVTAGWGQVEVAEPLFRYRKVGASMSADTEARFEAARREMANRHPGIYVAQRLRRLKQEWYPAVSVLVGPGSDRGALWAQSIEDVEVLPYGAQTGLEPGCSHRGWPLRHPSGSVLEAAAAARGKLLVDWSRVKEASAGFLAACAAALEEQAKALAAGSDGTPVVWRAWPLWDRAAPHAGVVAVAGAEVRGDTPLSPGVLDTGTRAGLIRQSPEGEGRLPEWIGS